MPKLPRELSPIEIGRLKSEGVYAVGGVPGLYLQIIGGSRAWVLRFVVGTRRRRMGLGGFPAVTLAQARDKARAARELMDQGIDPIQSREAVMHKAAAARARALTFSKASEQFIAAREAEWRNAKHRQQWENSLATYANPFIGEMAVSEIGQEDILKVLEPIWRTKTETASRVRGRIEQILDWAAVRGHRRGENPARWTGHLDKLLPKPSKIAKVEHHPAVEIGEAQAVVRRIEACAGMGARALLYQVLTATRSGEVRGTLWQEIDLDAGVWNIPESRMKAHKPHRVSLSKQAVQLLRLQPRFEDCELVFPSTKMTPLSDMSLTAVMRRLKLDAVPHGFRSTFSDWAAECTSYPRDLVEMALAHAIDSKVEAAYRRGDMLAKRAALMQAWADYCLPQPG
ncbi:tyrosine-type recombinase/integrase [Polaromonas naphthalenivorans]|uniref:Phage integrase family protein n=1 Tax=Polaromonas naphthalenivorans (strain CJ2) TaxID=365044 RepID=A1VSK3_POLNA|nr:integrase arm-type DNA-binding domain-containing protein [Polaromonas naphthalenivorans]ABM38631.1 phage integrase family protein [Polaromonas naphthalenivorans CJ2]